MKSYGAMAGRYLKQQKRRSILTVVGIILSVALISALGTMGQALKDNMVINTKYENGSFHFAYKEPTPELYETLRKNVRVDQLGYYRPGATTSLNDAYEVTVVAADESGLQLTPAHIQEGRLPRSSNELIVEQWLLEQLPGTPKLNGSTQLNDSDGNAHTYQIVGLLKNQRLSQLKGMSLALTLAAADSLIIDSSSQLFLTLKSGVDISDQIEAFSKLSANIENFGTNDRLLALTGESGNDGLNRALLVIFGTLVGLVVLSTAAVIYNAFHIAVLERIRQFGLLRTLGASPRQVSSIVFREATVLAAIGVPLGLVTGWAGLWLALTLMMQGGIDILQMEDFQLTFHWWIMGGSLIIGFLAVYLAAWLPARKASKVPPVEAVKGAGSIVRESYRRARIPSLLHLLGVEGQMASKNIRRNRTKFRITTFSIVISIMLFIVFHYFTQQALNITTTTNENDRTAFEVYHTFTPKSEGKPIENVISDDAMKELAGMPGVYGVYGNYSNLDTQAFVPDQKLNPTFLEKTDMIFQQNDWNGTKSNSIYVDLSLYDEARLKEAEKYLQAGNVDPAKLAAEDGVILVQTVKPFNQAAGKREVIELTHYKVGDKITLKMGYSESTQTDQFKEVTVAGILTQSPFNSAYQENMLSVIVVKETYAKLLGAIPKSEDGYRYGLARRGLELAMKDGADSEPIKLKLEALIRSAPGLHLIDIAAQQKETRQFNLQMNIFVYSFLIIIGGIGSLNIINTVQTNLLLRRKEISLLQAVGMTMGQIRKMASAEGVWFGVIGSFWGILLGVGFSYLLFVQLSNIQGMPFEFPWGASLIAAAIAIVVGLISVQGPLRRMEKANLLEQLREEA
jgi:putative ABC transport system permease protein